MEFLTQLQSGVDEHKPSLFELLSENQLADLLPPTLRYLLATATPHRPRYLLPLLNRFHEAYAILSALIEHYYLTNHASSFTENFYGLKRERIPLPAPTLPRSSLHPGAATHLRDTLALRRRDIWKNLCILILPRYILAKLDESYDIHIAPSLLLRTTGANNFARRDGPLPPNATLRQRAWYTYKWFLRHAYPHLHFLYRALVLAHSLAYLFDSTPFPSPLLRLAGTRIRRVSAADVRPPARTDKGLPPGWRGLLSDPRALAGALAGSLRVLLPTGIFALKFLEWWHASDFARQLARKASEGLELPPPELSLSKSHHAPTATGPVASDAKSAEQAPRSKKQHQPPVSRSTNLPILTVPPAPEDESDLCPICLREITTATATPYGFVFCYQCIFRWVEGLTERQRRFMEGGEAGEEHEEGPGAWREDEEEGSKEGRWEDGRGRCAVSGMRILGGTGGLRRVVV